MKLSNVLLGIMLLVSQNVVAGEREDYLELKHQEELRYRYSDAGFYEYLGLDRFSGPKNKSPIHYLDLQFVTSCARFRFFKQEILSPQFINNLVGDNRECFIPTHLNLQKKFGCTEREKLTPKMKAALGDTSKICKRAFGIDVDTTK